MLGRVVTNFSRKILDKEYKISKSGGYFKGVTTLLDLVGLCEKSKDYIVFTSRYGRREVAYVHDIRFDYVHGKVFYPVFTYKYKKVEDEDIKSFKKSTVYEKTDTGELIYNQSLDCIEIWNSQDGFVVEDLVILHSTFFGTKFYKFSLKGVCIRDDIQVESAHELILKYVRSSVYNNELTYFDYYSSKYRYISSTEKRLLKKYNLDWYSCDDFSNVLNYRDVRAYKYIDLQNSFTDEELAFNKSFYSRVIDFESYLMCHLAECKYWSDFDITNVLSGKWFFSKYKEKGISFIFKKDWLLAYSVVSE